MTLWSDLFNSRHLISRTFYGTPTGILVTAPPKAAFVRSSMVGAGGWDSAGPTIPSAGGVFGYGAAFARVKATCTPGEGFDLNVGGILFTHDAGNAGGDSSLARHIGGTVICKAARGTSTAAGAVVDCIGDTKRAGFAPAPVAGQPTGGSSGSDDADTFPLGFGGRGASPFLAAAPGGGGCKNWKAYFDGASYELFFDLPPGNGRVCLEFFDQDPAIVWPGY